MGEPGDDEVTFEFVPLIRQYRSGRVERLFPENRVPPSVDAATGVASRDVTVDPATGLWARLYLPDLDGGSGGGAGNQQQQLLLPVVLYLHGGGLVVGSAAEALEHGFANRLCARARVIVVSVDYRLAPEHPVPACYDDAWSALRWAAAGAGAADADPWLRDHGDRDRVFVAGYSAGGNIAHNVTMRAGAEELPGGARVKGMALLHPYFVAGKKADGEVKNAWLRAKLEETWSFACGGRTTGPDDPRINPVADGAPSLRQLGCDRVLVCLAADELELRGKAYYDGLLESGWAEDAAELLVSGEDHEYFQRQPDSAKAAILMDKLVAFFGGNK
ncbi:2-hydroxyisoflavanone dehydratase-like [Oryza brachyantha]|uniref:2-hydroxyisoflavanone dehydratase-like n=1 Tax=Oryza brachyantha TaxID=4533 RepID=UPI001ADA33DE|nr:2-hydroxyisoflavanone dehydratase-like [Oryza brachyantha]